MNKPRTFEETLLKPRERVLSTLDADGRRRWLSPKLSKGTHWNRRRIVAYALIAIFTFTPFIRVNGHPAVLLDVVHRRFHLFGTTLLPTDTGHLAMLILSVFLGVFAFTAIFGRVFCGWACPQTVWLEFVYRPIERLCLGTSGRGGKPARSVAAWRRIVMYLVFLLLSIHLAHTLLSYFVGIDALHRWIWTSSPWQHPTAFLVVALVTGWMMWDMAYWREQMCIIGCPYGRFQSALLDRNTVIVSYNRVRGEPRGKTSPRSVPLPISTDNTRPGDCIDCTLCVQVCPTGIDIRDGLQSECVNCAQCIDACNQVMDKVGRERNLIGYLSQAVAEGEARRFLRPRVVFYPALLSIALSALVYLLLTRSTFDAVVLRPAGVSFDKVDDTQVLNRMQLKITNRDDATQTYRFGIVGRDDVTIQAESETVSRVPLEMRVENVRITAPNAAFRHGELPIVVRITASDNTTLDRKAILRGPFRF
jgi:cytochrome c oxidase accessory protein FixG